jgi:hypothetical protein
MLGRPLRRLCLVALLAIGMLAVPIERAAACDCALIEMPDAIRDADVAFVGRLVNRVPAGDNFGFAPLDEWRWSVERSRDAGGDATITVNGAAGDGANCGVTFATGERWLVIASIHEGVLQTNGCQPNHRMDGSSPDTEAIIGKLLPHEARAAETTPFSVPFPVVLAIAAVTIIGGVGVLAFRRNG